MTKKAYISVVLWPSVLLVPGENHQSGGNNKLQ